MRNKTLCLSVLLSTGLGLGLSLPAHAEEPLWKQPGWERIDAQERAPASESDIEAVSLKPVERNGITFLTGGIGVAERAWLATQGRDYSLRIEMATAGRGAYVGGVLVRILDAQGKPVLEAMSDGPLMYVRLPAGRYRLEAEAEGQTRSGTVSVIEGRQARAYFSF